MRLRKVAPFFLFCLSVNFLTSTARAAELLPHPETYMVHPGKVPDIVKMLDDPKDLMVTYPLKDAVPPEVYNYLTFDIEEAKTLTEEIVGFRSPDLEGKIAPDIKPGKYTYQDLEKFPGLKDLFPSEFLVHIKPGGPPLVGNIPEFEIIPTRQLYWHPGICRATKQYLGKTKLDPSGYIVPRSWQGGIPFPRPSGKFKAQQIQYNFEKRVETFERCVTLNGEGMGYDKNLKMDKYIQYQANFIRLMGRSLFPPSGWFDERAKKNGEFHAFGNIMFEPRAQKGTVILQYSYDDPNKMDPWMIYVPSLRRIRKMAATDTQDPQGDMAYDDRSHLTQKITPKKYPYKFDIVAEREYLIPLSWDNSSVWIDSNNGLCFRDIQFMRRPCYALQMTQLNNNYIYSKRMLYIDKETFTCTYSANYDQRGQLYRSQYYVWTFMSEIGQLVFWGMYSAQHDHIDQHSTFQMQVPLPGAFPRKSFTIQELMKYGK